MIKKRLLTSLCLGAAFMLPLSVSAQSVAELTPTSPWLVNSAGVDRQLQSGGQRMKLPCVMANQYNNGFILRLSGGGGQLLSLSLDFRQNAFNQGAVYPAMLSVDGVSTYQLQGSAFSPGVLIFSLREAQGLYEAVQAGKVLALNVAGNTMVFSLHQAAEGMRRLESCYSPPSQMMQAAAQPQPITPAAPTEEVYIPRQEKPAFKQPAADDLLKAEAQSEPRTVSTPDSGDKNTVTASVLPVIEPLSEKELRDLNLTADDLEPYDPPAIEPQKTMVLAEAKPIAAPKVASVPKVEAQPVAKVEPQAVQPVEAKEVAAITPPKIAKPQAKEVEYASVRPRNTLDAPRTSAAVTLGTPTPIAPTASVLANSDVWEASAGEDIKIVLARWAERAGTDLVWEADGGGKVAQDVRVDGSFEAAVAQLMADNAAAMGLRGQFADDDKIVPVEKITVAANAPQANSVPTSIVDAGSEWRAEQGDDMKTVLQIWAAQNDVDLVWEADERFTLKKDIDTVGGFAEGVEAMLTQYDEEMVRPVGQLNRDPDTGHVSLIIQTDRNS